MVIVMVMMGSVDVDDGDGGIDGVDHGDGVDGGDKGGGEFFSVLAMKPEALCLLGKCPITNHFETRRR